MKIIPQLAESWSMAGDLRSCTLKLRADAKFQDDTPVDVAAVKANLERLMDKQRNPTNRPLWDPLSAVETPDAQTIIIRLSQPFSQLPNSLAHISGGLVSPAAIAKYGDTGIAKNPVGAGPYKVVSFDPGQQLVLEAFDGYWGGKPKTARLTLKAITEPSTRVAALRTKAADVIDAVPVALVAQLKADPDLKIVAVPGLRPIGFVINLTQSKLADLRVRQALNLAVPVETIAQKVFFGYARARLATGLQHGGLRASVQPGFNQAKAKDLLKQAGFDQAKPLELVMYVSQGLFPGDVAVGEIVANALTQVGVKVDITKIESGSYWDAMRQDRANLKWDIAMFGFNPANASGLYHLASLFKSNADDAARPDVWNMGRYRNPAVERSARRGRHRGRLRKGQCRAGESAGADLARRSVYLAADQRECRRNAQAGHRRGGMAQPIHQCAPRRCLILASPDRLAPAANSAHCAGSGDDPVHHLQIRPRGRSHDGGRRHRDPGRDQRGASAARSRPPGSRCSTARISSNFYEAILATRRPFVAIRCRGSWSVCRRPCC